MARGLLWMAAAAEPPARAQYQPGEFTMLKLSIALIMAGSLAVALPQQRGNCGPCQNGSRADSTQRATADDAQPEPKANANRRAQGQRAKQWARGQGKRAGQRARGQGQRAGQQATGQGRRRGMRGQANAIGNGRGKARAGRGLGRDGAQANPTAQGRRAKAQNLAARAKPQAGNCGGQRGKQRRRGQGNCQPCNQDPQPNAPKAQVAPTTPKPVPMDAEQCKVWIKRLQPILEAELYAQQYYANADKALNGVRRFQNLARAEGNHANAIANAIRNLGGTPDMQQPTKIETPNTIADADKHCEKVELHVIEIYADLIKEAPTTPLKQMFENIQQANRRHLNAVQ